MSINLEELSKGSAEGTITSFSIKTLREYLKTKRNPLTDKVIDEKFKNPDRNNLIVVFEVAGSAIDQFFMLPENARGFQKSNLKRFIDVNGLALIDIPKGLKKWAGQKVKVHLDANGYYRLVL